MDILITVNVSSSLIYSPLIYSRYTHVDFYFFRIMSDGAYLKCPSYVCKECLSAQYNNCLYRNRAIHSRFCFLDYD